MEGRKFVARVVIIVVGFYILMAVIGSIFDCNKLLVIYKTDKIEDSQFQQVSQLSDRNNKPNQNYRNNMNIAQN